MKKTKFLLLFALIVFLLLTSLVLEQLQETAFCKWKYIFHYIIALHHYLESKVNPSSYNEL